MYGFLARRGFNYEVSAQIVPQIWDEIHNKDMKNGEEVDT
jgi:SOS response regulatory protein OraA/RecX